MVKTSDTENRTLVIEALAKVRVVEVDDLRKEIEDAGGDIEVDSKQGQAVTAIVQGKLGIEGLIRVEDQKRSTLTSIKSLEELIERRRKECTDKEDN